MKKTFFSFVLLFLTLSLFSSSQFVDLVSANFFPAPVPEHSIEITAGGDVTGTDKIQRSGNLYTFTGDIVGSIVIFRDGIVVDGAGYTLQGNGYRAGIWLQAINNVEIKNLHIRNFTHAIELTYGMSMNGCTDITLSGNRITDNQYGISFRLFSGSNHVLGNTIANNTYGVTLTHSPNNTFRNNQLINNTCNLWVATETSVQMTHFINDIDESNTINGKPIIYWVNEQDKTVPSDAGYVALVNCTDITVQNLVLTNNSQGILLVATNNSLITRNHITNNNYGIVLFAPYEQCIGNIITENNITANTKYGILIHDGSNTITGNKIIDNGDGIYLGASNNLLRSNHMENNGNNFNAERGRANDVDTSNTVEGRPIIYWVNQ